MEVGGSTPKTQMKLCVSAVFLARDFDQPQSKQIHFNKDFVETTENHLYMFRVRFCKIRDRSELMVSV